MPTKSIATAIETFVREIEDLVRAAALEAVAGALGAPRSAPRRPAPPASRVVAKAPARAATPRPKRPSRARKAAPKVAPKAAAAAAPAAGGGDDAALAHVKAHPGQRLEEIAKALGVPSPSIKDRFAALVDAKKLRRVGKTRGTKYFVV